MRELHDGASRAGLSWGQLFKRTIGFGFSAVLLTAGMAVADGEREETRTLTRPDGSQVTYRLTLDENGQVTKSRLVEGSEGDRFASRNRLDADGDVKKGRGKESNGHHARAQGLNGQDGQGDRKVGAFTKDGDRYQARAQAKANGDQFRGKGGVDAKNNQWRKRAARNETFEARAKGRSKDGVKKSRHGRKVRPKGRTGQG